MALKMHPSLTVHVGDWLRTELLEPCDLKINEVSHHLGVSRQSLSALLNGRANLSADMALRFEKAFGVKAQTLLRMQAAYALAQARELNEHQEIKTFPSYKAHGSESTRV